jgi:hypothetical protein
MRKLVWTASVMRYLRSGMSKYIGKCRLASIDQRFPKEAVPKNWSFEKAPAY